MFSSNKLTGTDVTWPPVINVVDQDIILTKSVDLRAATASIVSESKAITVKPVYHNRAISSYDADESNVVIVDGAGVGGVTFDLGIHSLDFLQENHHPFNITMKSGAPHGLVTFAIGHNQALRFIPGN
jgi:hypothetical protein